MSKSGKKGNRSEELGHESMAGFDNTGAYLRKLRTEKGLSVKEACEVTRISEVNIKAIEDQDFANLPSETFIRGLLNIYARFLGSDPAHVVARFMREREQSLAQGKRGKARSGNHHQILTPKKLAEPAHVSSITMAGILLLFIVALFTGFCLYTSWNPFGFFLDEADSLQSAVIESLPGNTSSVPGHPLAPDTMAESSKPVAAPQEPAATPSDVSTESAAPNGPVPTNEATTPPPPADASDQDRITVEFLKDSVLTLTSANSKPVSTTFTKGDKQSWPLTDAMVLTFNQPESAVILVKGQQLPFPAEENGRYTLRLPGDLPAPGVQ